MAFPQSMRNEDQRLEYPKPLIDLWNNELWAIVQQDELEEYTQPIGVWGHSKQTIGGYGTTFPKWKRSVIPHAGISSPA